MNGEEPSLGSPGKTLRLPLFAGLTEQIVPIKAMDEQPGPGPSLDVVTGCHLLVELLRPKAVVKKPDYDIEINGGVGEGGGDKGGNKALRAGVGRGGWG